MLVQQLIGDPILNNLMEGFLAVIFAFFVGIISSALGLGGGFITTPSLILLGIDEAYAIGTVLCMIIFTALSSTIAYARQPNIIEYRTGLLVAITTAIGAIIGSTASSILATEDPDIFRIIFALCLLPIAIKMIIFPKEKKNGSDISLEIEHDKEVIFGFERRELLSTLLGFIAGFASGLLGVGGGVVMVPVLVTVGKIPILMIFTSIAGAAVKISQGQIHPDLALFLIIGIIIGAQIGPLIIKKINTKQLQQIFGGMMIVALISIAIGRDQVVALIQELIGFFV
jgi:uncharacterized membrane protein YfcA